MQNHLTVWYREPWPWVLILLPLTTVIASCYSFFLFEQHKVALVSEDYYQQGKAINQDLTRLRQAQALAIVAELSQAPKSDNVTVKLNKGKLANYPIILVVLQHRTLPAQDIWQRLTAKDNLGHYSFKLAEPLQGPWYIEITDVAKTWAINGTIKLPEQATALLQGRK